MLESGRTTQKSMTSKTHVVGLSVYLGVFLTHRTQNIRREWRSSIRNIILVLEK